MNEKQTVNLQVEDAAAALRAATSSPGGGGTLGLSEAVKAGLEEPSPDANKALWMESGSILFLLLFFFFSLPFFGSFLLSHGSESDTITFRL